MSNQEIVVFELDERLRERLIAACRALGVTPPELRERVVRRLRQVRVSRTYTKVTRFVSDQHGVVIEQVSSYTEVRSFIEIPEFKMLPPGSEATEGSK
ncbi:MAG: hypothetical protein FJW50_01725 [Actinobacteria bacterium]|nr:hypothetical protein [Actinomycetota bacterium]